MSFLHPRKPAHDIDPLFANRWSPRSFTSDPLPESDLKIILEAARWAPSGSNRQPWRFIYGLRGTPAWEKIGPVLMDSNFRWARNAGALILVYSRQTIRDDKTGESKNLYSHAFDAGAAWVSLALQASKLGYHAHAMGGIHHAKAMDIFSVPKDFRPEVAIAVGKMGSPDDLPEELRLREVPSDRLPLDTIAGEGTFPEG
jgi:nitroreductase